MEQRSIATADGQTLAASRTGSSPLVVLLHPGVCDRRAWRDVMEALAPGVASVAYDRPGFGETLPAAAPYAAVDHLASVMDQAIGGAAVVVGNSQGARIAIDFALARPDRVRGLVLIGPAVSGAPDFPLDDRLAALDRAIEAAEVTGDLDEVNRLEAHLWLDGPHCAEGRVGGASRDRFLEMNGIALRAGGVDPLEPPSAWARLEELSTPVLVVLGVYDVPGINDRGRELARRAPNARLIVLPGVAHVPALEDPEALAALIRRFVAGPW